MPEARHAPYPADTRAKGWRFELDMEQVRQSDTWALSPAEARPWLLLEWAVAWEQTPCGSLPNDDTLIAARLEMPDKMFAKYRAVLLRGWWLADDGRLYHDTLARRVMEMMQRRRKESDRKALARARPTAPMPQDYTPVPPLSHGTGAGLHPESDTGTGTTKDNTHTTLAPEWVLPKAWGEWAIAEYPHWTPDTVRSIAQQFADHQWSKAASSADWMATWRKWCRDDLTQRAHPVPKPKAVDKPVQGAPAITVPSTDKGAERFQAAMDERAATATKPPAAVLALAGKAVRTA